MHKIKRRRTETKNKTRGTRISHPIPTWKLVLERIVTAPLPAPSLHSTHTHSISLYLSGRACIERSTCWSSTTCCFSLPLHSAHCRRSLSLVLLFLLPYCHFLNSTLLACACDTSRVLVISSPPTPTSECRTAIPWQSCKSSTSESNSHSLAFHAFTFPALDGFFSVQHRLPAFIFNTGCVLKVMFVSQIFNSNFIITVLRNSTTMKHEPPLAGTKR